MLHTWLGTDEEGEDSCLGCGVTTPDFGEGVVSDHSPLPIFCPDLEVVHAHHFGGDEKELSCQHCGYTITRDTMPNEMDWACQPVK